MQQSTRSRKLKAVLASGAVLGIGAAVTLAAWTDNEAATASFSSGVFLLESTTDGDSWTSNEEPVALSFDASDLTPDDSVAALFGLRLSDETTFDAALDMATVGEGMTGVTYDLYEVADAADCTTDLTGESLITDSALDGGELTGEALAQDEPLLLCYVVSADDTLEQTASGSATWTFTATSN